MVEQDLDQMWEEGEETTDLPPPKVNWDEMASSRGFPDEPSMWKKIYHGDGCSIATLAEMFAVSHTTIRFRFARCDISPRPRGGARNIKGILEARSRLKELNKTLKEIQQEYENLYQAALALRIPAHQLYSLARHERGLKDE
jgi:hypothetical protein